MKEDIDYVYAQDQYFQEMKDADNMRNRLDLLAQAQPFIGKYYSDNYVRKNILRLSDNEVTEIAAEMEQAQPDPTQQDPQAVQQAAEQGQQQN